MILMSTDIIWKECHIVKHWLISNTGLVHTTKFNKLLKQHLTGPIGKQYLTVSHRVNGQIKHLKVHRLAATLFCENPGNKTQVNHKDGNKLNNNDWNLEWVTPSENSFHAINTGLSLKRGEDNHNAVLSSSNVREIKLLYNQGMTQAKISILFNVDPSLISRIVNNKIWKYATAS